MLVYDDEYLRDMYTIKFTEQGHEVDVADSGLTALAKIRRNNDYDVILLDMIMPGMSGFELLNAIKKEFLDLKAKCIVLSNQGQTEDVKEAKEAGAVGYIIKAESVPSEVLRKVEEITRK